MTAVDTELDLHVANLTAVHIALEGDRRIALNAKRLQNFIDMLWETKSNPPPTNEDGSIKRGDDGEELPRTLPYAVIQAEMQAFVKKEAGADIDDWEAMAIWGFVQARKYPTGEFDKDGNPILQNIIGKKKADLLNQGADAHALQTSQQSSDPRFAE